MWKMKIYLPVLFAALLIASCAGTKKLARVEFSEPAGQATDSVEYELVVLDPGFETWYILHSRPSWYHTQNYYELWNRQYVTAWNTKAMSSRYSRMFESTIDYDPFTDYGLEINHKLFYYFQYVERELGIPILSPGTSPHFML